MTDIMGEPNPIAESAGPSAADEETSTLLDKEFSSAQAAAMREEFGSSPMKRVLARLTETPANWHQATVFVCTSAEPEDVRVRWWLMLGSLSMVLFQCAAAIGALRNTQNRSCSDNVQCDVVMGMYCEDFTFQEQTSTAAGCAGCGVKQANRCSYCGRSTPVPLQINISTGEVWNRGMDNRASSESPPLPREFIRSGHESSAGESYWRTYWLDVADAPGTNTDGGPSGLTDEAKSNPVIVTATIDAGWNMTTVRWVCENPGVGHSATAGNAPIERNRSPLSAEYVRNWCEECVYFAEGDVLETTEGSRMRGNIQSMGLFDRTTLLLAAVFLSLASIGELKDCKLCTFSLEQRQNRLPLGTGGLSPGWRRALMLIGGVRKYVFLPSLMACVGLLAAIGGCDALSVCLNTIVSQQCTLCAQCPLPSALVPSERSTTSQLLADSCEVKTLPDLRPADSKRVFASDRT